MRKIFLAQLVLLACYLPNYSHAQVPDGGLDVFQFPCTCSPFTYNVFLPLYLASAVPITGALAAPDTPNLFAFYVLHVGAWARGFYTPGVQACLMYVGVGCAPLPVLGTQLPYTGTSLI